MKTTSAEHVLPMFCAFSFHGNSMNYLLSYCGLFDAKIGASYKDLSVKNTLWGKKSPVAFDGIRPNCAYMSKKILQFSTSVYNCLQLSKFV